MKCITIAFLALFLLNGRLFTPSGQAILPAQTAPPLALKVDQYDLSVRLVPDEAKAEIEATLQISNPARQPVSRLALRVGEHVQVTAIQVDGAKWIYNETKDERSRTIGLSGDLARPLPPGSSMKVVVSSSFNAEVPSKTATVAWGESFLLPESFWAPMVHTPFLVDYNVDTAPCRLIVSAPAGMQAISAGQTTTAPGGSGTTGFVMKELVQPYFIAGDFELWGGKPSGVEIYLHRGYASAQSATLLAVQQEVQRMVDFYAELLAAPVAGTIRVVGSSQLSAYGHTGLLILEERTFSRKILDEETIAFLATNVARMWVGARQSIQGPGHGVLYDGLPSYLMSLYMERAYGPQARQQTIERFQRRYLSLVTGGTASDAPLGRQTLLSREYYTSIFNKVPMVMRLLENELGREKFIGVFRNLLNESRPALSLADFQAAITGAGSPTSLKPLFDQWFHEVVLPDFAVGKPVKEGEGWSVNLANFGTGDAEVTLEAKLSNGEERKQRLKIESQGYARAVFKEAEEPVFVRVDGERLYLQSNYANDTYPQMPMDEQLTSQGTLALWQSDFKTAETKLREAIGIDPDNREAHAGLARVLAQTRRNEEAVKEVEEALKATPLSLSAYAMVSLARGDMAMASGRAADAVEAYRQAALSLDDAALLTARDSLVSAERAASVSREVESSVASFLSQFDAAVSSGRPAAVKELVAARNARLKLFVAGVSFVKSWKSELLRAERLDEQRLLIDLNTRATTSDREHRARALYLLRRQGTGWILDDIPAFLEK
ncbi:MAG: tetratricopeptide repeat protein [Acidobacteria bacterium]|nr:tetratricopeptide repeat protein [Acidobacteriota bacterium]